MPTSFSQRLVTAFENTGQLCVGIDPHEDLLLEEGLSADISGLESFSLRLLDEISDSIGIVKPQASFFERFGSKGFAVLERICLEASSRGLIVIADAKRGDIGSTMVAYSQAWLAKDAPFLVDALTVNPYLGVSALSPAIENAAERGKAIFVLCATSNSEGRQIQSAQTSVGALAKTVATEVAELNSASAQSKTQFGTIGLVIGATAPINQLGLSEINLNPTGRAPILAPGFGFQGATLSAARSIFGENSKDTIFSVSRSVLRAGLANAKATTRSDAAELAESLGK